MAVTQNTYTGNGSTTNYAFTFPYLAQTDVKVKLDGVTQATTEYTFPNATTVSMDTAPANGATILIFRDTNNDNKQATFYPGSAIKAEDLNNNYDQILYTAQEVDNYAMTTLGDDEMIGDFKMGSNRIIFEGATADAHETFLTVTDPTADRTITLPNVTGTVVTTGDTGTVTATMLAANSVDSSELVDGSIDTVHIGASQVTTAKIAADAITGAKIADDTIDSEHYVAGSIDEEHIRDHQITNQKLASGSVSEARLASDSVTTGKIVDLNVTAGKIASNAVIASKIQDGQVTTAKLPDNAITTAKILDGNITTAKIAADAVNADKIADDAVRSEHILANAIGTSELASNSVTNVEIATATVLSGNIADGNIGTGKLEDNAVTSIKIADNAVTTAKISDAELTTLAGMQTGTASILAGGTALAATLTEINTVCDGKSVETTISDTDAAYPTSGAVIDYVTAQIAPLGGLEVIATEVAFPNTQPSSGVVISISDAGGVVFNGSGTSTTGRTVGGSTVTINNAPSSLNSETLAAGVGLMVSSTGSSQTYNYHKILGKEDDIKQLSDDINDFAERYRVGTDQPTSSLHEGDLWYDQSNDRMMVYNSTTSNWEAVTATGNFYINTISSYSGTGGNSATFNGTAYRFTISSPPNAAQQLIVSINGVIQKPNAGASQPAEGFAISGTSIIFSSAPASGSDYFIITIGSAVNIGTPSDNSISTVKLQNLSVTSDKIAADSVTGAKIADDAVGAEHIEVLDAALQLADNAKIQVGAGADLEIYHNGTSNYIQSPNSHAQYIDSDLIIFRNGAGSEQMAQWQANTESALFYDNSKKFETTSVGVTVSGNAFFPDNYGCQFGNAAGSSDLKIYHSGSHSFIVDSGTGMLSIDASQINFHNAAGSETLLSAVSDGAVSLYYDNSKKFETYSSGVIIDGHCALNDNGQVALGDQSDLRIFHSGANAHINHVTSGNMFIDSIGDINFRNTAGTEYRAKFVNDGAVELYHNGIKKAATVSEGLAVYGSEGGVSELYFYADEGDDDADKYRIRVPDGGPLQIGNKHSGSWHTNIECNPSGNVELNHNNVKKFETLTGGIHVTGDVSITGHYLADDNEKLKMGDGADLQIFHDGYNRICGNDLYINNLANTEVLLFAGDGREVQLYYDNSKKFETYSGGSKVTGDFGIGTTSDTLYDDTTGQGLFYYSSRGALQTSTDRDVGWAPFYVNKTNTSSGSDNRLMQYQWNGSAVGSLEYNGSDVVIVQASDYRLKKDITSITDGITKVKQLKPVRYKWNDDATEKDKVSTFDGFVAHELQTVLPQAVLGAKDATKVNEEGQTVPDYQGVTQDRIIPILTAALQEAIVEIETLKTKVAALEAG